MTRLLEKFSKGTTALVIAGSFVNGIAVPVAAEAFTESAVAKADIEVRSGHVMLYGEVSEPDQIGKTYMVLEKTGNRVVGAFFQPLSSFDCFTGQVADGRLALNIEGTYTGETSTYSLGLEPETTVAAVGNFVDTPLQLQGFQSLGNVTANDQRILSTCKAATR